MNFKIFLENDNGLLTGELKNLEDVLISLDFFEEFPPKNWEYVDFARYVNKLVQVIEENKPKIVKPHLRYPGRG